MRFRWAILIIIIGVICCSLSDLALCEEATIRYIAMGDSYTIGEGAGQENSWPALLTGHLQKQGVSIELVANLARTGWTTQNLIDRFLPEFESSNPSFATLLIGVNDWVQGVEAPVFRANFKILLNRMLAVLPQKERLLIVTIPDFSVAPLGPRYSAGRDISAGIAAFNAIIKDESQQLGLTVVDIYHLSQEMGHDPTLVSVDGLHPSAIEYAAWEKVIFPEAFKMLSQSIIVPIK